MVNEPKGRSSAIRPGIAVVIALVSAVLAYAVIEVGYRVWLYVHLKHAFVEGILAQQNKEPAQSNFIWDAATGYRYRPNLNFVVTTLPYPYEIKTNQYGMISDDKGRKENFPIEKPASEYRIAVLGDSFTANITNTVRWPALLQEKLNNAEKWRRYVGGRTTRVLNFGQDGVGINIYGAVMQSAAKFAPDLVIINIVEDSIYRRIVHRGKTQLGSPAAQRNYVEQYVVDQVLAPLPWRRPYPELVAVTLGARIGLKSIIRDVVNQKDRYYSPLQDGVAASLASVRKVFSLHQNVLLLHHPTAEEMNGSYETSVTPERLALEEEFFLKLREYDLIDMLDRWGGTKKAEAWTSLFWHPYDYHNSDHGLRIYANLVSDLLIERATSSAPGMPLALHKGVHRLPLGGDSNRGEKAAADGAEKLKKGGALGLLPRPLNISIESFWMK